MAKLERQEIVVREQNFQIYDFRGRSLKGHRNRLLQISGETEI